MRAFWVVAYTPSGQRQHSIFNADTLESLQIRLQQRGEFLIHALAIPSFLVSILGRRGCPNLKSLATIFGNLSHLLAAGLPIERALECLTYAVGSRLKGGLQELLAELRRGSGFNVALRHAYPSVPDVVLAILQAAEHGGRLSEGLRNATDLMEQQVKVRNQIRQALAYPAVVVVTLVIVMSTMISTMVPQVIHFLTSLNQDIPLATKALVTTVSFIKNYGFFIGAMAGVFVGFFLIIVHGSQVAQRRVAAWCLRIPHAGALMAAQCWRLVLLTLAALLKAGVPLIEALRLCEPVIANAYLRHQWQIMHSQVQQGRSLAECLRDFAPPVVLTMVNVGEQSGQLSTLCSQAAAFFQTEIESRMNALNTYLQPVALMLVASLLLWLAFATLLPLYDSLSIMGM